MFTDIVDYSKMVQSNQVSTLKLVEEHNNIINTIKDHHGGIIKFTGDGYLIEFDSSTSAVKAAISMQYELS